MTDMRTSDLRDLQPRIPPHSMEAEQSVLGGLLIDNSTFDEVAALLSAEDFYAHDHGQIFRAISEMVGSGKPCDVLTLSEHLRAAGKLSEAGGLAYVGQLAMDVPSAANVLTYAQIVRQRAEQRALIALSVSASNAAYSLQAPDDVRTLLNVGLERMQARRVARSHTFAEAVMLAHESAASAKQRRAEGLACGVPYGLKWLDERTGGMQPGQLIVIAARPSIGKSAFLNQIALHAASAGHPGLICSLEMTPEEVAFRAVANRGKVNVTRLTFGSDEEMRKGFDGCMSDLMRLPLWLDTDTYTLSGILGQIAAHRRQHGIQWAAVDHIGLIEADGFNSRNDQLGVISRQLKKLAKALNIPILALSQLNRNVERERRAPVLSDLRDSGNIEQDANIVAFLHTDSKDGAKPIEVDIHLAKNRGGRKGSSRMRDDRPRFEFWGDRQEFVERSE